jgi:uncharacterized SAM-binding protein YcdF (DUF218 family)
MKKISLFFYIFLIPILFVYFVILHVQIQRYSNMEVPKDAEYLIILGAKVNGTVPSLSLQYRIDAAADYLLANPKTIAIATGGQGAGENVTEAETIKKALIGKGVEPERIRMEDQSTTTYENLKYSLPYLPTLHGQGIVVTNHYHVYRAVSIAADHKMNVSGYPAKTPFISLPKSYIREYLAITKYYLKKYI